MPGHGAYPRASASQHSTDIPLHIKHKKGKKSLGLLGGSARGLGREELNMPDEGILTSSAEKEELLDVLK